MVLSHLEEQICERNPQIVETEKLFNIWKSYHQQNSVIEIQEKTGQYNRIGNLKTKLIIYKKCNIG